MPTDAERNAAFYDELAAHYDAHLTNPHDALARAAFQELVGRCVAAGSTLLDFGCGTGVDALEYARRGYRVPAYDNSDGMVAELERWCRNEIAAGAILPYSMGYSAFLKQWPKWPAPSAAVANFAVLNSIRDPEPLFEKFAQCLAPPGWVIVSILNPVHRTKLRAPRWWLNALRARGGPAVYLTRPYASYLHFVRSLVISARRFRLMGRANAGNLVRYDEFLPEDTQLWWGKEALGPGQGRRLYGARRHTRLLGHFVFLVFRRDG